MAAGRPEAGKAESRWRKRSRAIAWLLAKLAISCAALWYFARGVELEQFSRTLHGVSVGVATIAGVLLLVQLAVQSWRWLLICRRFGLNVAGPTAIRFSVEAQFFNQALPSSMSGDAIKVIRLSALTKQLRRSFESVIVDRAAGLLTLAGFVGITIPVLYGMVENMWLRIAFALVPAAGLVGGACFLGFADLPRRLRDIVVIKDLAALSKSARSLLEYPLYLWVLFISIVGHLLTGVIFWILAIALHVQLGLVDSMLLVPAGLLVTIVPVSIAGWGLREGALVALLPHAGLSAESAFALSVLYGLVSLLVSLPGLALWAVRR